MMAAGGRHEAVCRVAVLFGFAGSGGGRSTDFCFWTAAGNTTGGER